MALIPVSEMPKAVSSPQKSGPSGVNVVELATQLREFQNPALKFSVSGRNLHPEMGLREYLRILYIFVRWQSIEDIFGSTIFPSGLYGGRSYKPHRSFTGDHIAEMEQYHIGLSLTLTNHYFDERIYKKSYELLKRLHRKGNSVICVSDELAVRIKNDFPLYAIKASIIKNLDTHEKVKNVLKLYDQAVIPMEKNDDDRFLEGLEQKERIILFANAGCAYACPARTCYKGYSQANQSRTVISRCSREMIPRLDTGQVTFNINKFSRMGFTYFKLIPSAPAAAERTALLYSRKKKRIEGSPRKVSKWKGNEFFVCSFPKSGRTWLRFLVGHYLNLTFGLEVNLDFHSIFSLLPNDTPDNLKGIAGYRYGKEKELPLILFSHALYEPSKFGNANILFMVRSIPDVVVSYYFHNSRLLKKYPGDLKSYIRSNEEGLVRYCRYLNSWSSCFRGSLNHLVVSYESFHGQAEQEAEKVIAYLNIPLDGEKLKQALRFSSFIAMGKMEAEKGIPGHEYDYGDPESRRVRKGKIEGSKEYLDDEDMAYMFNKCDALLTKQAKNFLTKYKIPPYNETES